MVMVSGRGDVLIVPDTRGGNVCCLGGNVQIEVVTN